jgi:hypothetical protein
MGPILISLDWTAGTSCVVVGGEGASIGMSSSQILQQTEEKEVHFTLTDDYCLLFQFCYSFDKVIGIAPNWAPEPAHELLDDEKK